MRLAGILRERDRRDGENPGERDDDRDDERKPRPVDKNIEVTDPGRAPITGQCADSGKVKGPILRGLAARAPYFHNGSATTLLDVVTFYDQRFDIGFTDQQKADQVAFLSSL